MRPLPQRPDLDQLRRQARELQRRNRVDLGLRLRDLPARGRLESGKGVGNGSMTVCLPLASPADLDDEALEWLKRAYDENT